MQIYANTSSLKATLKYTANIVILLIYRTIAYMNLRTIVYMNIDCKSLPYLTIFLILTNEPGNRIFHTLDRMLIKRLKTIRQFFCRYVKLPTNIRIGL